MKRFIPIGIFLYIGLVALIHLPIARAQVVCNPAGNPSGSWIQSFGSYDIGDVAIFGPSCGQISDGGIQAATSITPISGATNVTSANCGTRFLATIPTNGATYALTAPSAASLPSNCIISATAPNNRGLQINFTGLPQFILWPSQNVTLVARSTGWIVTAAPGLWVPNIQPTLCVYKGGNASDTQDGLDGSPSSDLGAGCLALLQTASNIFYGQINLAGAGPIIALNGVNSTVFTEALSMGGQLTGNNLLTLRVDGGALVWQSATACITVADNANFAFNANNSIKLKCNTSNTASTGAFFLHQFAVFDINHTAAVTWVPGGSNDHYMFIDSVGNVTISGAGGLVMGDSSAESAESIVRCDHHCGGITLSGALACSPNLTIGFAFILRAGSFMNTNATFPGCTIAGSSPISGNSVLWENGTTIPGGATATTGAQIFTSGQG